MSARHDGMERAASSAIVRTYAVRLARRCVLQSLGADEEHPVLIIEHQLIEMARSMLREHILTTVPSRDLASARPLIEARVIAIARGKILAMVESEEVRELSLKALEDEDLGNVFASVH